MPNDPEHALTPAAPPLRGMSVHDFHQLAEVPPALTWFANIDNPQTRRAYQNDVHEFMAFTGLENPKHFRDVSRAHVLTCWPGAATWSDVR